MFLKELQKGEQRQPKVNRIKEIIKISADLNEIENKKTKQKSIPKKKMQWRGSSLKRLIILTNPWLASLRKNEEKNLIQTKSEMKKQVLPQTSQIYTGAN